MIWTRFMDMHSGGGLKEKQQYIYIEAPEDEAKIIFYNRFGHNPERVTCTCCGDDYSISEYKSLIEATAYERGCDHAYFDKNGNEIPKNEAWKLGEGLINGSTSGYVERKRDRFYSGEHQTIEQYLKNKNALFLYGKDIEQHQRKGEIPEQGYVWVD